MDLDNLQLFALPQDMWPASIIYYYTLFITIHYYYLCRKTWRWSLTCDWSPDLFTLMTHTHIFSHKLHLRLSPQSKWLLQLHRQHWLIFPCYEPVKTTWTSGLNVQHRPGHYDFLAFSVCQIQVQMQCAANKVVKLYWLQWKHYRNEVRVTVF